MVVVQVKPLQPLPDKPSTPTDSGSRHTRDDGVVDKRMQGDSRQNGSYR